MTTHTELDADAIEMATMYLSGQLDASSRAEYQRHLSACGVCRQEVDSLHVTVAILLGAAPEAEPPEELDERLFARIGKKGGETIDRAAEAQWEFLPIPGVSRRVLFVDRENDRQTFLLKMDAKAHLPKHGHGGVEECYVVEGHVRDGDLVMTAGDFSRYEAGTSHGPLFSEGGCVLLISASLVETHP